MILFRLYLISAALLPAPLLSAQAICPPGASGAETCASACLRCEGGVWSGSSGTYVANTAPGFCGTLENDQWFGFLAGANRATFTLQAADCRDGAGLELAIYAECDAPPIACGAGALSLQLKDVPLTPGHRYRLLVDGYQGDVCRFTLSADPLTAITAPTVETDVLEGPGRICPGGSAIYSLKNARGARMYTWMAPADADINGQPAPFSVSDDAGKSVVVTFGHTGGTVSVQGANECRTGPVNAVSVVVKPIPPTLLPLQWLCHTDTCRILPDQTLVCDTPGTRTVAVTLLSDYGCDSTILYRFREMPANARLLPPIYICRGDSAQVFGRWVKNAGIYRHTFMGWNTCDSTEYVSVIWGNPALTLSGATLACYPPETALHCQTLALHARFAWSGPGGFQSELQQPTVQATGLYRVTVTDLSNGCSSEAQARVRASSQAPRVWFNTVRQGAYWRVFTQTTAVAPSFEWSGPGNFASTAQNPLVSLPGLYTLRLSDGVSGCQSIYFAAINEGSGSLGGGGGMRPAVAPVWSIAPNPVEGDLYLHRTGPAPAEAATAVITDALGRRVGVYLLSEEQESVLAMPALPAGLYRLLIWDAWGGLLQHTTFMRP